LSDRIRRAKRLHFAPEMREEAPDHFNCELQRAGPVNAERKEDVSKIPTLRAKAA
jgi:hypothetical protein